MKVERQELVSPERLRQLREQREQNEQRVEARPERREVERNVDRVGVDARLRAAESDGDSERRARVERIKQDVRDGSYQPDREQVAAAVVRELL